jgi:D-alanyl-D-alanine carboxypeptidase/D-alanyl-D-alanine-endopeptidase (penicillin-binding protein 4)
MEGYGDYAARASRLHGPEGLSRASVSPNAARARTRAAVALALVVLAAVATPVANAGLRAKLDRALDTPYVSQSLTGAVAVDLTDGSMVFAQNASRSLRPASNEKLVVALATLDRLGPGFRIETQVLGKGTLVGGVWQGRLFLKGFGDPSLSNYDLARLAAKVRDQGITKITGRIVGDESYYDKQRTVRGWKPSYYKEESPPLSALIVNRGRVAKGISDNPAAAAARAFRRDLIEAGIRVPSHSTTGVADDAAVVLAERPSVELAELVQRMNIVSDNFYAEMLLKQLGARVRGEGTSAAGARVVVRELDKRGVPLDGVKIIDGSGLSSYDRLTARALAALLISAWSDPVIQNAFVTSLPVAGVSGTLEDRMTTWPAYGRVRAKTGTTNVASALSGYASTEYVFAVVQNGFPVSVFYARRAQDRFATVLAGA